MKYPCDVVKDLLPLYVDEICSEKTKAAVSEHLNECEECKKYYCDIKEGGVELEKTKDDKHMEMSLKDVKKRLNKKYLRTVGICVVLLAVFFGGFKVLFSSPIKEVSPDEVTVTVDVYSGKDLIKGAGDDISNDGVYISVDGYDSSEKYVLEIPALGNSSVTVSGDVLEKNEKISAVSFSSNYFLREIKYAEDRSNEDGVIYISAFKTTVLNNKADKYNSSVKTLEFGDVKKVVYVEEDGSERVLWENK